MSTLRGIRFEMFLEFYSKSIEQNIVEILFGSLIKSWNVYWTWKDQSMNQIELFGTIMLAWRSSAQSSEASKCLALVGRSNVGAMPTWLSSAIFIQPNPNFSVLHFLSICFPSITLLLGLETFPISI